jgi:hypothetical protein
MMHLLSFSLLMTILFTTNNNYVLSQDDNSINNNIYKNKTFDQWTWFILLISFKFSY